MSITYDSTELVNATYIPRYVQHESAPERSVNTLKLARQDGEVIVDDTYGVKYIDVRGVIKGSSQSNLESTIDSFKELISRKDKNLDISWAGGTRRYVCRAISHDFSRDFFHILHCPYTIRFLVADGYGKDTSETTAINEANITASPNTQAYTFLGSYKPKPKHKITLDTRGNLDVVRIENDDTGDYIDIDWGNVSGDPAYVEVDEEELTVLDDSGDPVDYRGKFPSVELGYETTLKLYVYGSGSTIDQSQTTTSASIAVFDEVGGDNSKQAQSFIPSQSGRVHKISAYVLKVDGGTLSGAMQFLLYDDDNGKPGNNLCTSGEYEIAHDSVPTSLAWTDATWNGTDANRPFLTAGKKYWLVLNSAVIGGADASNYYGWAHDDGDGTGYTSGKAMFLPNGGVWTDGIANSSDPGGGTVSQKDMTFKIYRGVDGGAASWQVDWLCTYTKKYL